MKRPRRSYRCPECGHRAAKWHGRCPECDSWGGLEEEAVAPPPASAAARARSGAAPVPFPQLAGGPAPNRSSGLGELDRVLGGGLVPGAVVLLAGEPGIGKSTLLLQAAAALAMAGGTALYVTGEESAAQLRMRGERLGVDAERLLVLAETDVDAILAAWDATRPDWCLVDSIQAVRCADLPGVPGSVSQVREAASRLTARAKESAVPTVLVGHVTKDGSIAGPRVLEHLVDTVLHFEGDRHHAHRILRTLKNRFGPADELAVFGMAETGLREVANPSELFLAERPRDAPGSAVFAAIEGSRPLLVEVQALVGEPNAGSPRRTALGIDGNRLALILAVLGRAAGLDLADRDVFVNVTGGLRLGEPAADLAVAAAVASSHSGRALPAKLAICGELGLTGEVRGIARLDARLKEAARLGFDTVVLPPPRDGTPLPEGIEARPARDVRAALEAALRPSPVRGSPT